ASHGHAVEARIYAEDTERDFLPQTGTLTLLHAPDATTDLRVETGVRQGDSITPHYDPMIAKVAVWGDGRAAAIKRLSAKLGQYRVAGVATNRDFLLRLSRNADFGAGAVDTGFIARHHDALAAPPPSDAVFAAANRALAAGLERHPFADRFSPWTASDGWRLDGAVTPTIHWRVGDKQYDVAASAAAAEEQFDVVRSGDRFTVIDNEGSWQLDYVDPFADRDDAAVAGGRLTAPMPGKIVQVLAKAGEQVKRGQPILILEAMKMEHTIAAPADGTVDAVNFAAGELVEEGAALIAFTAAEAK
ncbi:MAG: biotin/lipoyl-containing protein, partial [Stellaceae bacterium]